MLSFREEQHGKTGPFNRKESVLPRGIYTPQPDPASGWRGLRAAAR